MDASGDMDKVVHSHSNDASAADSMGYSASVMAVSVQAVHGVCGQLKVVCQGGMHGKKLKESTTTGRLVRAAKLPCSIISSGAFLQGVLSVW